MRAMREAQQEASETGIANRVAPDVGEDRDAGEVESDAGEAVSDAGERHTGMDAAMPDTSLA